MIRNGEGNVWWPWGPFCERFGPLRRGHLTSLLASTGAGKTTFVASAAMGWLEAGINLALLSTEMPSDEIREKMAAAEAQIPERWLACGDLSEMDAGQKLVYERTHARLSGVPIIGLESFGDKTVETLQSTIGGVLGWYEARQKRLEVLVIDHLHEIVPRAGEGQLEAWANVVLMLRDMAAAESVAVVLVVQPRRPERQTIPSMYRFPDVHDARGVPQVETCSQQVYGLRRRLSLEGMDLGARRALVAEIAANIRKIHDFALPATEVRCLKHRRMGSAVNHTVELALRDGKLIDPDAPPF